MGLTIDPEKDSFVLLACDGIWNSLSSQETVDFISTRLNKKNVKYDTTYLTNILKELFDHCLAPDTMGDGTGCDNMTAVIAKLKPNAFSAATAPAAADKTAVTAASAEESTKSDLTEKTKPETVNAEANSSVKRPAEDEPDKERIPEPQAKKVKTDSDNSDTTTTEEVETTPSETETKTEPETV